MSKFHCEIEKLKEMLSCNVYSNKFIGKCISKFMNKLYIKKPVMLMVSKKRTVSSVIFYGENVSLSKVWTL